MERFMMNLVMLQQNNDKIYFYNGSCWLITEDKPNIEEPFKIINAGFGTSYNFEQMKYFSTYPDNDIDEIDPEMYEDLGIYPEEPEYDDDELKSFWGLSDEEANE